MNTRAIGTYYESVVCEYLKKNNYEIATRNFRARFGEIDIIAKNEGYLCFIEVKYRDKNGLVSGVYAVDKKKQNTIYNVAKVYMSLNNISEDTACRFDVVSVDEDKVEIIKNAFP